MLASSDIDYIHKACYAVNNNSSWGNVRDASACKEKVEKSQMKQGPGYRIYLDNLVFHFYSWVMVESRAEAQP